MNRSIWVITVMLLACGRDKPEMWTTRPVRPVSRSLGGLTFTIDLPENMRENVERIGELDYDFVVQQGAEDYVKTPEIYLAATSLVEETLDAAANDVLHRDITNWVRKDTLPDGYIMSYENPHDMGHEDYIVERVLVGPPALECRIITRPWSSGDTVKDKLPQIEKICTSIKLVK